MSDFAITDLNTLEWYTGKLTEIQDRKTRINAQFQAMIADLNRDEESLKFQFEAQARAVLTDHLEHASGRAKHVKFLSGTIGFRSVPARLTMITLTRALEWSRTHAPNAIMERVDLVAIRKHFNIQTLETGELAVYSRENGERVHPQGFATLPGSSEMYIKTAALNEQNDPDA